MLRVAEPPHFLVLSPAQFLLQEVSSASFFAPLINWMALPHLRSCKYMVLPETLG